VGEYAVIGLGRFGRALANELQELGHHVVGIDRDREAVQEMAEGLWQVVEADATSEAALRELEVTTLDGAVVAMAENVEASILVTMILKKLGVKYVISKAGTDLHGEVLARVGADRVVHPERETAMRLAHSIGVPEVIDYLTITPEMGVSRLQVPRFMAGRSVLDTKLEQQYQVRLLAIIRQKEVVFGPGVNEVFQDGDVLLIAGHDRSLDRLHHALREEKERTEPREY
jgi:trk system potassium uptake protein